MSYFLRVAPAAPALFNFSLQIFEGKTAKDFYEVFAKFRLSLVVDIARQLCENFAETGK